RRMHFKAKLAEEEAVLVADRRAPCTFLMREQVTKEFVVNRIPQPGEGSWRCSPMRVGCGKAGDTVS
ncbi:hypothetical protein HNQ41_003363, partial [Texcoconibacillus texcoconensis]|nr:hypothetical protein [Texcoconibacillus texcoconensis]